MTTMKNVIENPEAAKAEVEAQAKRTAERHARFYLMGAKARIAEQLDAAEADAADPAEEVEE